MNAYCPECETDLDPGTGICPACRWDPLLSPGVRTLKNTKPPRCRSRSATAARPTVSPSSRTIFGAPAQASVGVSRGRIFVVAGLVLSVGVYGVALAVMGPFWSIRSGGPARPSPVRRGPSTYPGRRGRLAAGARP